MQPCRSGLVELPEDVLMIIVGNLPLPSLMAVRLVCRLLRKVSIYAISSLDLYGYFDKGPAVNQKLQALQGLTRLSFSGEIRQLGSLLKECPKCTSLLREFCISQGFDYLIDTSQACAFEAFATELTALTRLRCSTSQAKEMAFVLASFARQLACLELPYHGNGTAPPGLSEAIQQLTALQTLRLGSFPREFWEDLLPRLTSLPYLKDLAAVPVEHQAMAVSIAAITSLTRLQIRAFVGVLDPFTKLSALEALRLTQTFSRRGCMSFEWLPLGMSQLTELAVFDDCTPEGFNVLMASLGRLASLHLQRWRDPFTVGTLLEAPLQGLQHLSVGLAKGSPLEIRALSSALTRLECLSISVRHASVRELFQHLPQVTRLTSLWIEVAVNNMERVPATFLTSLTWLSELNLYKVLSKHNVQADIACIAMLTRLQCLILRSPGKEKRRRQGEPEEPKPPAVEPRHLQPLSALRWLEVWDLDEAWRRARGRGKKPNEVVRALCAPPGYSKHDLRENKCWRKSRFAHSMSHPQDLCTSV